MSSKWLVQVSSSIPCTSTTGSTTKSGSKWTPCDVGWPLPERI